MSRSSRPVARRVVGLVLLGLLATACGVPGFGGPDPEAAVRRLATALSAGSVGGVDFVGGAATPKQQYAAVTAAVQGRLSVGVRPGKVTADGDSATGRLDWSWKIGTGSWRYTTSVRLSKGATSDGDAWLVRWAPSLVEPSLKQGEVLGVSTTPAVRGEILGAGDRPLVALRPVLRVGVDKTGLDAATAKRAAGQVAALAGVDAAALTTQVVAAGPRAFVQAIVYRAADVPAGLRARIASVRGATAVPGTLPLAPTKDFASAILGTVGPATAELVKASDGRIRAGDEVGLSGLQKRYDEQLAGTRGTTVSAGPSPSTGQAQGQAQGEAQGQAQGQTDRRVLFTADPVAGEPLRTTIDSAAQQVAQSALAGVRPASALVAIRPSTGELVAVASGPGSKGYNTATFGRYAPGSTFKIVTSLALLRSGVTPSTQVSCPPTTVVDGKRFKNYSDYPASGLGRITLEDAVANSCNTAFISERGKLGPQSLAQAAAALGLGVDHDTGFPAFFGQVGAPASQTQAAASMIGQGTVLASPMSMATVVASVLHGSTVLPRLLPDVKVQEKAAGQPLTATEARQLRTMLRAVVERGSGSLLADVPGGGQVIAKTGTAEFGDTPPLPTHAWMVAGRGDLAVAVFVERGQSGSQTAGPVLKQFLQQVRVP